MERYGIYRDKRRNGIDIEELEQAG